MRIPTAVILALAAVCASGWPGVNAQNVDGAMAPRSIPTVSTAGLEANPITEKERS